MNKIIKNFTNTILRKKNENFSLEEETPNFNKKYITAVISIVIADLLLMFLGKFFWNNYLVNIVTFIKPIDSILDFWALSILFRILRN